MTADARLAVLLGVVREALGAYLERLQAMWADAPAAAVGARADPGSETVARVRAMLAAPTPPDDPLDRIARALGLSPGEEFLTAAAWWSEADPQVAVLLGCAHDDAGRRFASAALLRLVMEPFGVSVPGALDDGATLVRGGVLEPGAGATGALRLTPTARLVLDGRAPEPLTAPDRVPARLERQCSALARHLRAGVGGVVLLEGARGAGRRDLATAGARAAGLHPIGADRPGPELKLLARLRLAVPIVPADGVAALDWEPDDGPLVAWGEPASREWEAYVVDVRPPGHDQRARHWTTALVDAGLDPAPARALAARFMFTEADIDAVLGRARLDAAWSERQLDPELVWEAARRQPRHSLGRVAALVAPAFSLDELVLADDTHAKLRELVAHVALQHVVLDDWGFRRWLPRGQGVAALFTGPPGTGKTTAAEALACELGQDLYRIDLSAVVSKYVGETEKNLAVAFDEAERAGAVLFFDEADSLFGKRTEIRDAHDRYANLEVSYLLQRVETFTGLVVLASNRRAAVDEGFIRRLRFVIRFEPPDAVLRRRLWERSFPPQTRVGDLDWDALATAELAGGSIQSTALAAAYMAARDGGVVTRDHVAHALLREHQKLGKAWAGLPSEGPA